MNFLFSVFPEGFSRLLFDQLLCSSPFMCRWCQLQTSLDFRAHACRLCPGSSLLGLDRILMDFISLSFTRKSNNQQQNVYFLRQPREAFKLEELQHQCPPLAYFHFSSLVSERRVKRGKRIFQRRKRRVYSWRNAVFTCQSQTLMWIICVRRMQDALNCSVTIVTKLFVPTSAFIWFSGFLFGGEELILSWCTIKV